MFYKQITRIGDDLNEDILYKLDFWLGTIPENKEGNITASFISLTFQLSLASAQTILEFWFGEKILAKYYIAKCPECSMITGEYGEREVVEYLNQDKSSCSHCLSDYAVTTDNVYVAYRRIKKPDMSDMEIAEEIMMYIKNQTHDTEEVQKR